jgi:hypothetical protein
MKCYKWGNYGPIGLDFDQQIEKHMPSSKDATAGIYYHVQRWLQPAATMLKIT